jgi:hypothetical protein
VPPSFAARSRDEVAVFLREDRAAQLDATERHRYVDGARMRYDAPESRAHALGDDLIIDGSR